MADIKELKQRIDLHDLAERLGIKQGKGGPDALYHSPAHPDKNPSLSIYVNHPKYGSGWKDHSGDAGGDHVDLVVFAMGGTKSEAMRWLHEAYAIPFDTPQRAEAPRKRSQVEYIADNCARDREKAAEYLVGRHIAESAVAAAIRAGVLGYNQWTSSTKPVGDVGHGGPAAAFIVRDDAGQVVAVDMRFIDPAINGDVKTQTQGEKVGHYWTANPRRLKDKDTTRVYLVESSINALSVDSCGMPYTAAVSIRGTGNAEHIDLSFLRGKQVYICMDNDQPFPDTHPKRGQRPGPQAAWVLYERLTAMEIGAIMVDQAEWVDARGEPINDVNDYLCEYGADELREALETYEPWLIAGLSGDKKDRKGKQRFNLPPHDLEQYWRFRTRLDLTRYIAKKERSGEDGEEKPVYSDLCGFRIASLSRVSIASDRSVLSGEPDLAPVVNFAVTAQVPRHGAELVRRVMHDEQLHNVQQWNKIGAIWQPAQFSRMVTLLERTAALGARKALNFVGLGWLDGRLVVNEGADCFFTNPMQQCTYHSLTFPSGPVSDARRVITAYQATFAGNAATMPLVWGLGGHLKALLGFWPHMEMQASKGAGKSTLTKRLESTIAFTMFSGQTLQTEFRLVTSCSYTSHPVGWEEISARKQEIIDKAVALLQESYQSSQTTRGGDMTRFLISAPVLLAGEDAPVRSLHGKLVRTTLRQQGPMIPDDLPAFPVRQWLEFLAGLDVKFVRDKHRELEAYCRRNSSAGDDSGAKRMASNYAAMLLAWRFLCEFAGMEYEEGNFARDLTAEMNTHIKATDADREPWVWIMETVLSEMDAGRFAYPFKFEQQADGDVHILVRPVHIIDHFSSSTALREKWNGLPIKTATVFKRQLEMAGVLVESEKEIERTIQSRRVRHLSAISINELGRFGLSVAIREDQPHEYR